MIHHVRALSVVLALAPLATAAGDEPYKPFTAVNSVCPKCTTGPQYDRIVLTNGKDVYARVVAENESFLVMEKFGELRAVTREHVKNVEKNSKITSRAGFEDQVLFKDNVVFAGTIKTDADGMIEMTMPWSQTTYLAPWDAIALAYRGGKLIHGTK